MGSIVSYCGLICTGCPIHWATNEKDEKLKEKMKIEIAKLSNQQYGTAYGSEDILDCDGCTAVYGRLFSGCNNCQIRNCALQKNIPNCAHCPEYICESLETFFADNPESKSRLDFLRSLL